MHIIIDDEDDLMIFEHTNERPGHLPTAAWFHFKEYEQEETLIADKSFGNPKDFINNHARVILTEEQSQAVIKALREVVEQIAKGEIDGFY